MPRRKSPKHDSAHSARQHALPGAWEADFLRILKSSGSVTTAARCAGIDRQTAYNRYEADPKFAEAFEVARRGAKQRQLHAYEEAAVERVLRGTAKPVIHLGQPSFTPVDADGKWVAMEVMDPATGKMVPNPRAIKDENGLVLMVPMLIYEKSDALLLAGLKATDPKTYREKFQVTHDSGGDFTSLADADAAGAALLAELRASLNLRPGQAAGGPENPGGVPDRAGGAAGQPETT